MKILIVEDEENIRNLILLELKEEGYEVYTAKNANEAIEKFNNVSPEVVILDIKLEEESGIDVLKEIKSKSKTTKVILYTAYEEYKHDFETWLADAYVVKSSDISKLKEAIKKLTIS
jgi:DNA-binding response OmpR family regulator